MVVFRRRKHVTRMVAFALLVFLLNWLVVVEIHGPAGIRLGVAAATAQSAERGVAVFVLPAQATDEQAAAVFNSIVRTNVGLLRGVALRSGSAADGAQLVPEIGAQADRGFALLDQRNYAGALEAFRRAEATAKRALTVVSRGLMARVTKGLGCALFLTGDRDGARDYLRRTLLIFDHQSPDEYAYSLDLKGFFREVQQEQRDLPAGAIEVRSDPAGAEVILGFDLKGFTTPNRPFVLQNLLPGNHFLRLVRDGHAVWAGFVAIKPAETTRVSETLAPTPERDRLEASLRSFEAALTAGQGAEVPLRELARLVQAGEVLGVTLGDAEGGFLLKGHFLAADGTLIDVEEYVAQDAGLIQTLRDITAMTVGGEYGEPETISLDVPAGTTAAVAVDPTEGEAEDLVLNPDSPIFRGVQRAEATPVYKKWWFWTVIGVVAAGATTGIVLLTTSDTGGGGGPTGGVSVTLTPF